MATVTVDRRGMEWRQYLGWFGTFLGAAIVAVGVLAFGFTSQLHVAGTDYSCASVWGAWSRGTQPVEPVQAAGTTLGDIPGASAAMKGLLGPTSDQAASINHACATHRRHDFLIGGALILLGTLTILGSGWGTRRRRSRALLPTDQRPPPGWWWDGQKWNAPAQI